MTDTKWLLLKLDTDWISQMNENNKNWIGVNESSRLDMKVFCDFETYYN